MRRAPFALIIPSLFLARVAFAQLAPTSPDAITVSDVKLVPLAEVRSRGEYRRDSPELGGVDALGHENPRVRDAWAVFERARLGLTAEREALVLRVTLQDARAWGTPFPSGTLAPPSSATGAQTGVHEAYLEMRTSSAQPSFLRIGRQVISWGDGSLIGAADWSPTGRAFDAVRGRTAFGGQFGAEAFGALIEPSSPLGVSAGNSNGLVHSGVSLFGVEGDATIAPLFKLSVYGLARISRSDGSELDGSRFQAVRASGELYAMGLRASGEGGPGISYAAEGTYEVGTASAISQGDVGISAFAAHGFVAKKFDELPLAPSLRLGGAFATGDDGSGTYKQFDPLFADPHQYGAMDIFALTNHIEGNATVSATPMTDATVALEYRYARLESAAGEWLDSYLAPVGALGGGPAIVSGTSGSAVAAPAPDKELGHEISALASYKPWRGLVLAAGYDFFLFGDGARTIMAQQHRGFANGVSFAPANFGQFAYLSASVRLP